MAPGRKRWTACCHAVKIKARRARRLCRAVARHPDDAEQQSEQQPGRPHRQHQALRRRGWQRQLGGAQEDGDRQVDQPRPVLGRVQRVRDVEPALAGEQVADLHQPHGVVGRGLVGAAAGKEVATVDAPDQQQELARLRRLVRDGGSGRGQGTWAATSVGRRSR